MLGAQGRVLSPCAYQPADRDYRPLALGSRPADHHAGGSVAQDVPVPSAGSSSAEHPDTQAQRAADPIEADQQSTVTAAPPATAAPPVTAAPPAMAAPTAMAVPPVAPAPPVGGAPEIPEVPGAPVQAEAGQQPPGPRK